MSNFPPPTGSPQGYNPGPVPAQGPAGLFSNRWGITEGPPAGWQPKQKMVAGLLGILIGSLGVHSFYVGNTKKGIIQLVAFFVTCGAAGLWGFIEGIMILVGNESFKTDAYGVPLTE